MKKHIIAVAIGMGLTGATAHAVTPTPVPAPSPVEIAIATYVVKEAFEPKPFCKVIKIFKRKSRC